MDKDLSIFCLQACINSYKGEWGKVVPIFHKEYEFGKSSTQGYFAFNGNNDLFIVFQGSVGIWDWMSNIRKSKVPFQGGSVHKGFYGQYVEIRDFLMDLIRKHQSRKMLLVGHSLGGAIATLLSLEAKTETNDITCVTFGCPKVGDQVFAETFQSWVPNTFRFVNNRDAVPKLPVFGYVHVGQEINIGGTSSGIVRDHDPRNYMRNLKI